MTKVYHFSSRLFDPLTEEPNPNNPIAGASILEWLRKQEGFHALAAAESEDWGWYANFDVAGRNYMIGASMEPEASGGQACVIQVHKSRSFIEKILGRAQLDADDPLCRQIEACLRAEPGITGLDAA